MRALALAGFLVGCASVSPAAPTPAIAELDAWTYDVFVDPALSFLEVKLCADASIAELEPAEELAGRWVAAAPVRVDDRCFAYRVRLMDAAREEDSARSAELAGDDIVFSPDLWLWRPVNAKEDAANVSAAFHPPPGISVSLPWPVRADGRHSIGPTTFRWRSIMAIGRFEVDRVEAEGAVLDVARVGRPMRATPEGVRRWLSEALRAVTELYGALPFERVQVIVEPVSGEGLVHFGLVNRGGGPSVLFLISDTAADEALPGEWVAVHELSHLTLPFIRRDDVWLPEGFATYYQAVLRARAGHISELDAWQDLHEGFGRGRVDAPGSTLDDASAHMGRDHHYMRVYWSGAAIALLADVALRKRGRSLDEAIAEMKRCCLDTQEHAETADDILEAFDRALGGELFRSLAARWVPSAEFPALEELYRELGLIVNGGDQVSFDDQAPLAPIRAAIMSAKPKPRRRKRRRRGKARSLRRRTPSRSSPHTTRRPTPIR